MALSEKTLELNITHEILSIADSFWHSHYISAVNPHIPLFYRAFHPYSRPMMRSFPYATGLSLQDELKIGYDVRIDLPPGLTTSNVMFLQFKLGSHRYYSINKKSSFYRKRPPHQHVIFHINNNSEKDQHVKLNALASNPGYSDSVLYALPLITNATQFKRHLGRLCQLTTFLTINDIQQMANSKGIIINAGNSHELRINYLGTIKELHSEPNNFSELQDKSIELISEIINLRLWRQIQYFKEEIDTPSKISLDILNSLFYSFIISQAYYWCIPFDQLSEVLSPLNFSMPSNDKEYYSTFFTKNSIQNIENINKSFHEFIPAKDMNVFTKNHISKRFSLFSKIVFNTKKLITNKDSYMPETKYSVIQNSNSRSIHFENISNDNIESISYQLF